MLATTPSSSRASSPFSCSASPAITLSAPLPSVSTLASSTSLLDSEAADPDLLWTQGKVLVPTGFGAWPEGMYARDMARGFSLVAHKEPGTKFLLPERFLKVFAEAGKYSKQTWHQQYSAWMVCKQDERDTAAALPRTYDGLWSTWRRMSTGWAKISEQKRASSHKK